MARAASATGSHATRQEKTGHLPESERTVSSTVTMKTPFHSPRRAERRRSLAALKAGPWRTGSAGSALVVALPLPRQSRCSSRCSCLTRGRSAASSNAIAGGTPKKRIAQFRPTAQLAAGSAVGTAGAAGVAGAAAQPAFAGDGVAGAPLAVDRISAARPPKEAGASSGTAAHAAATASSEAHVSSLMYSTW